jgi:hypothetical protein
MAIPITTVDSVNVTMDRQQPTVSFHTVWVKAAATTYRNPRSGSQFVQADSHSERPLHPTQFGWQEWREATRQASRQWCRQ